MVVHRPAMADDVIDLGAAAFEAAGIHGRDFIYQYVADRAFVRAVREGPARLARLS